MAGSGKRADTVKPSLWKGKYFGKFGFKKKGVKIEIKAVNLSYLEEKLEYFLNKKLISKEGDSYIVDMEKLGFNKLLSEGKVLNKFKIKVPYASKKAVEKVKNVGGEVNLKVNKVVVDNKKENKEK